MPDTVGHGTRDAGRWTREAVLALPDDGQRHELLDGELVVTPAPAGGHQEAVSALCIKLGQAVALAPASTARVLVSPADLALGEDEVLQPDIFVCHSVTGGPLREWSDVATLLLVIEILSPSTARYDRGLKRLRYQRAGVPEYWIVDLDGRVVERWTPGDTWPEVMRERLHWASGDGATLDLDLGAFFAQVRGE